MGGKKEKIEFDILKAFIDDIEPDIPWKYGVYKIGYNVKRFFVGNVRKPKKDLNLIDQVESVLSSYDGEPSQESIDKCKRFIELHRIMENTSARKRLEKWATKVIGRYLLIVALLLLSNGATKSFLNKELLSENIIIAILTTTTVNIIGLVLIVLRGHFYENDIKKGNQTKDSPKPE